MVIEPGGPSDHFDIHEAGQQSSSRHRLLGRHGHQVEAPFDAVDQRNGHSGHQRLGDRPTVSVACQRARAGQADQKLLDQQQQSVGPRQ
jgi:hypothetical protein